MASTNVAIRMRGERVIREVMVFSVAAFSIIVWKVFPPNAGY